MKVTILTLAVIAFSYAQEEPIAILKNEIEGPNTDGSYKYSYETANGIKAEEQGALKNLGNEETEAMEVHGSYSYTAPDGTLVSVTYIANENGFQPQGTHISGIPEVADKSGFVTEKPEVVAQTVEQLPPVTTAVTGDAAEASFVNPVYRSGFGSYRRQQRRF